MITLSAVLNQAATGIANYSPLNSWITSTFGAGVTLSIYVGDDHINPVGKQQAPYVVLAPGLAPYDMGVDAAACRPSIDVDFGLVKETTTVAGNITTFDGIALADAMGLHILNALAASFPTGRIEAASYSNTPSHSLYEAGFVITFNFEGGVGTASL